MMSERSLFLTALEKGTPEERTTFLDEVCAEEPALRARLEALLQSHLALGGFLETPLPPLTLEGSGAEEALSPGTCIGPYRLVEKLGEGGMGVVYRVEQETPLRRQVALKVVKPGLDSAQVIGRLEAERQALALMEHSHIARVLDAGTTDAGRPYFVMELVQGPALTAYCDQQRLTVRERLALFVPVCEAIEHAHQKGIIHRDLKPSNVLVALQDRRPVPKVIDFGVAKALGEQTPDRGGGFIGTLEYMAPEQAGSAAAGDVDTRSDIYALGVLLYELLTGTTPLAALRRDEKGVQLLLRIIRENEAPRPSQLITACAVRVEVARLRRTTPARLASQVRGELDAIVRMCLGKDRRRRYPTASALAGDVERFLGNELVDACLPSTRYWIAKLVSRHWAMLTGALAFVIVLLTAAAVSTWAAIQAGNAERQASTERDRAIRAEEKAGQERDRALAEKARADEQANVARAVSTFVQELLTQASPDKNPAARTLTVVDAVKRADQQLGDRFKDRPLVEAAIRQAIGDTLLALADYPAAQPHLEKALELRRKHLGEDNPETLHSLGMLAGLYLSRTGQLAKAEELLTQGVALSSRARGKEDPLTLTFLSDLGVLYHSRAYTSHDKAMLCKAEAVYQQVLAARNKTLGLEHPDTLSAMINLGLVLRDLGRGEESERLWLPALTAARARLGEGHPLTFTAMGNLAQLYHARGSYAKAEELYTQALAIRTRVQGKDHPHTLHLMLALGKMYVEQGQHARAEPLLQSAAEGWLAREKIQPTYGRQITETLELLVRACDGMGQAEKAQHWRKKLQEFRDYK
jgi:non-specific serine/threonine protein kinase/serine/threonine-protein kinase